MLKINCGKLAYYFAYLMEQPVACLSDLTRHSKYLLQIRINETKLKLFYLTSRIIRIDIIFFFFQKYCDKCLSNCYNEPRFVFSMCLSNSLLILEKRLQRICISILLKSFKLSYMLLLEKKHN